MVKNTPIINFFMVKNEEKKLSYDFCKHFWCLLLF